MICQTLEVQYSQNCEIDSTGGIVPKVGFSFIELFSSERIIFEQKTISENGNKVYNQTLSIINKIDLETIKLFLSNSHLIVKLQKIDGSTFIWGSLAPYNPVQVEIIKEDNISEIQFYRKNFEPEY